jgi:hypothetical protein
MEARYMPYRKQNDNHPEYVRTLHDKEGKATLIVGDTALPVKINSMECRHDIFTNYITFEGDVLYDGKVVHVPYEIKKVIFNDPCTIVLWADGTKTVVKTQNNEVYDAEKGLAMCISKKALGNKGNYFEVFKKHTDKYPYVGMKHEEYVKAEQAYHRLMNCLHDKKALKSDMTAAMEEAVGYLGEVLDI